MFEVIPVPEGKTLGWELVFAQLRSKFGTLTIGLRPEGYGSWSFKETGGGGAVTLLTSRNPAGQLLVGLLHEKRPNMGDEPVWCIVGGFIDPGETHQSAQAREAQEETGLSTGKAVELPGLGINPNRAFFDADASKGEGVKSFAFEVPFEALEQDGDGWRFQSAPSGMKKSENVRFFPWQKAVAQSADGLALAAIAKLLSMAA